MGQKYESPFNTGVIHKLRGPNFEKLTPSNIRINESKILLTNLMSCNASTHPIPTLVVLCNL